MKRLLFVLLCLFLGQVCVAQEKSYEDRWFYASFGLRSDEDTDRLADLIRLSATKDLNGMLWACGIEYCGGWNETMKARVARIRKVAQEEKIEIIPIIWSVGYGTMLGRNPNLVEAIKIDAIPFHVHDGKASFVPGPGLNYTNPSMEEYKDNKLVDWAQDSPGIISFVDTQVKHSGNASVRFENFTHNKYGHGRLFKLFKLRPQTQFCVTMWYKTEELKGGNFMFQVYQASGEPITSTQISLPADGTRDWTQVKLFFNSAKGDVRVYAGLWGGKTGKVWFDDLAIEEIGLVNPVRRDGTPFVVTNAQTKQSYVEGKDYTLPSFKLHVYGTDTKSIDLNIPQGSSIADGADLLVSYYQPGQISNSQRSVCMSEPELYEYFKASAQAIVETLKPRKWFLSMDEIRAAGSCQTCKKRGISLAAILGDCITKQYQIIKEVSPDATVYIWSDMIDPNHNCHNNYYLCEGDYTGAWDLIPKDIVVSCWYHGKREASMKFFSEKGFRTQGAAYYDTDTIDSCADWLETCNHTKNCTGIMYTTWQSKYALLPAFGDLVRQKSRPMNP